MTPVDGGRRAASASPSTLARDACSSGRGVARRHPRLAPPRMVDPDATHHAAAGRATARPGPSVASSFCSRRSSRSRWSAPSRDCPIHSDSPRTAGSRTCRTARSTPRTRTARTRSQLTFGDRSAATPMWSRDGTKFAYKLISPKPGTDRPERATATSSSQTPTARTPSRSIATPRIRARRWSPDGRWLVYSKTVGTPTTRSSSRLPTARARRYASAIPRPSTGRRSSPRTARRSCTSSGRDGNGIGR